MVELFMGHKCFNLIKKLCEFFGSFVCGIVNYSWVGGEGELGEFYVEEMND